MAETGSQSDKTRDRAAPVTAAPTRSQVNRESKAPDGGQTAKVPPVIPAIPAAKPPPSPRQPGTEEESQNVRRRGDQPEVAAKSPKVEPSGLEERDIESGPESGRAQRRKHSWHIPALAAQVALALICMATELTIHERRNESDANIPLQAQPKAQAGPTQVVNTPPATTLEAMHASEALTAALDELDVALEAHPERSPEEMLRQASNLDHDCMLAWHDHAPSLIFGKKPIEPDSLADTIQACADAVRRQR